MTSEGDRKMKRKFGLLLQFLTLFLCSVLVFFLADGAAEEYVITYSRTDQVLLTTWRGQGEKLNAGHFRKGSDSEANHSLDLSFSSPEKAAEFFEVFDRVIGPHPGIGWPGFGGSYEGPHGIVRVFYKVEGSGAVVIGVSEDGSWIWRDSSLLRNYDPRFWAWLIRKV